MVEDTTFLINPLGAGPVVGVGGAMSTSPGASALPIGLAEDIVSVRPSVEMDKLDSPKESRTFVVAGITFL